MSELSKKARNRTRVQMILTMLVIVSIIRQFFLGNYHNMFLGILTLILFMVPQFIDTKEEFVTAKSNMLKRSSTHLGVNEKEKIRMIQCVL